MKKDYDVSLKILHRDFFLNDHSKVYRRISKTFFINPHQQQFGMVHY